MKTRSTGLTLLLLIIALSLSNCNQQKYLYEVRYVVFYPTTTDTVTVESWDEFDIHGEYIHSNNELIYGGKAPFKILHYTKTPMK